MQQPNKRKKMTTAWLIVILWAGVIFTLSSIPSLKSELSMTWDLVLRKGAHIAEYTLLGYLIFRAMTVSRSVTHVRVVAAIVIVILYAMSDEIHQAFVPGRSGLPTDVVIDSFGATLGVLIAQRQRRPTDP